MLGVKNAASCGVFLPFFFKVRFYLGTGAPYRSQFFPGIIRKLVGAIQF